MDNFYLVKINMDQDESLRTQKPENIDLGPQVTYCKNVGIAIANLQIVYSLSSPTPHPSTR